MRKTLWLQCLCSYCEDTSNQATSLIQAGVVGVSSVTDQNLNSTYCSFRLPWEITFSITGLGEDSQEIQIQPMQKHTKLSTFEETIIEMFELPENRTSTSNFTYSKSNPRSRRCIAA